MYGTEFLIPKHHFTMHLPTQAARDGVLTDTFVVERSHLLPKNIADEVDNSITFEKSTIQRVILARMISLESFDERGGLEGHDVAVCPGLSQLLGGDAVLAAGGIFDGIHIARGDVLQVDGYTFFLSGVCKCGDRYFLLGLLFDLLQSVTSSSSVWSRQDSISMLELSGQRVRRCHAWSQRADNTWLTLHSDLRRPPG